MVKYSNMSTIDHHAPDARKIGRCGVLFISFLESRRVWAGSVSIIAKAVEKSTTKYV